MRRLTSIPAARRVSRADCSSEESQETWERDFIRWMKWIVRRGRREEGPDSEEEEEEARWARESRCAIVWVIPVEPAIRTMVV